MHHPSDDSPVLSQLTQFERALLNGVDERRFGPTALVVTALSIVASITLAVSYLAAVGRLDDHGTGHVLFLASAIPALVAPVVSFLVRRVLQHLNDMAQIMEARAVTDDLTGVANRRGFFAQIDELTTSPIEVAMVDLDNFKQINDQHGHAAGDRALQMVAEWLDQIAGDNGIVARIGGDEFALAAPPEVIDRLGPRTSFIIDGIRFSASSGRAPLVDASSIDATLADADAELFGSKRAAVDGNR